MGPRRIVIVTYPDLQPLDVVGPAEVFDRASRAGANPSYRIEVAALGATEVTALSGITIATRDLAGVRGPIDTLVISGGEGTRAARLDPAVIGHINRLARQSRRVASVCTGAFLLAEAGLLDGRRATTHWAWAESLSASYPRIDVDVDAIFIHDGPVWTSAGVTAGMDLALALVAEDHGSQLATDTARQLVMYVRRNGGQSQFSAQLAAQTVDSPALAELLGWMGDHLEADLSVAALARRVHLSERQFARTFRATTNSTPASHVEALRVEAARRLLETTDQPVERIARRCGFGTPDTMHRAFRRRLDVTPSDYRRHFQAAS